MGRRSYLDLRHPIVYAGGHVAPLHLRRGGPVMSCRYSLTSLAIVLAISLRSSALSAVEDEPQRPQRAQRNAEDAGGKAPAKKGKELSDDEFRRWLLSLAPVPLQHTRSISGVTFGADGKTV